jgi:hypothetical protein
VTAIRCVGVPNTATQFTSGTLTVTGAVQTSDGTLTAAAMTSIASSDAIPRAILSVGTVTGRGCAVTIADATTLGSGGGNPLAIYRIEADVVATRAGADNR